jgi:nucleotide-binding universal stress UspA family protein
MKIRRILCPTDFSEFSDRALEHAAVHARWAGAELALLHVNPLFVPAGGGAPYIPPFLPLDAGSRAQRQAELDATARVARAVGLEPEMVLLEGDPAEMILQQAHTTATDLIVMGTHGLRGFDRWMLGSVANRVVHRARCAVLTVPRPPDGSRPAAGRLYERILCAVDLAESEPIIGSAVDIGRAAGCPVTLLHVLDDLAGQEATALLARLDWPALRAGLEEEARRRLVEAAARSAMNGTRVEPVVATGRPYREILNLAGSAAGATLVVMGMHGRNPLERLFLGSSALQVLRRAPCPVLTVRLPEETKEAAGGL